MATTAVAATPRPPVMTLPGDAILTTADGRRLRFDSLVEMTPGAPAVAVTLPCGGAGAAGRLRGGGVMAVRTSDRQRFEMAPSASAANDPRVASRRLGATAEEWRHFGQALGLAAHLLPTVCNPNATPSPGTKLKAPGKAPMMYNEARQFHGLEHWPERQSTPADIDAWAAEPDYGVCVQAREVRGIDIDVDDPDAAAPLIALVERHFGTMPKRCRDGVGRVLMPFRMPGSLGKRTVNVNGGMVEVLADGNQWVACGTHVKSGGRYFWAVGLPEEIPEVTEAQFEAFWADLATVHGIGGDTRASASARQRGAHIVMDDPAADYLRDSGLVLRTRRDGGLDVACPWAGQHSSGEDGDGSTTYWPAGSNGYAHGAFKCMHESHGRMSTREFLLAVGCDLDTAEADFGGITDFEEALGTAGPDAASKTAESREAVDTLPAVVASATAIPGASPTVVDTTVVTPIDGSQVARPRATPATPGRRQAVTLPLLLTALRIPAACGWRIGRDDFSSSVMISPAGVRPPQWRKLVDTDNIQIREHLERNHDFGSIAKEVMRDAIDLVAAENRFDSAQTWLGRLEWDGIERVEGFLHRYFGAEDTPYTRAVSRYICTAMAGRVLQPGVKADMVPVAVGGQGTRKSTTIAALVPDPMYFAEVALDARDADTVRLVRGKLVVELAELSGMRRRDAESLKAFLSATNDQLIEKYKEHSTTLPRRCVFFGSSNRDDFLTDSTGSRRWLPFRSGACDPEVLERDRDQLWAEASVMFKAGGVDHAEAERLARAEHEQFAEIDAWDAEIERCLGAGPVPGCGEEARYAFGNGPPAFVTSREVLSAAGLVTVGRITRADEMRAAECLKRLGWRRAREMRDGVRQWGFARP